MCLVCYSVVGGLDTLTNMEKIETDKKDRPLEDILIQDTVVFVNPYEEVDKEVIIYHLRETCQLAIIIIFYFLTLIVNISCQNVNDNICRKTIKGIFSNAF